MAPVDVRRKGFTVTSEDIVGQAGTIVPVNEARFVADEHILDPNSPLAVQIPEGGADTTRNTLGMVDRLTAGTPMAQFAAAENDEEVDTDFNAGLLTPDVYSETEVVRTANPVVDVADLSPGAELRDEVEDDEAVDTADVDPGTPEADEDVDADEAVEKTAPHRQDELKPNPDPEDA